MVNYLNKLRRKLTILRTMYNKVSTKVIISFLPFNFYGHKYVFTFHFNHGKDHFLGHNYIMMNATSRDITRLIRGDSIIKKKNLVILTITSKIIL